MKTRLPILSFLTLAALALMGSLGYDSIAQGGSAFYVPVGRSELMSTSSPMGEVIVADPAIADIYVHGRNKVSVIGKMVGTTTVRIFDEKSRLIRSANVVVTYDLPSIRKALRDFLPYERIGVSMVNTRVALTGDVSSAESARTAVEIAEQYVATQPAEVRGDRPVRDAASAKSPIINLMKVSAGQQVMLRIRVGEIQRTALKDLGVGMRAFKSGSQPFLIGTGPARVTGSSEDADPLSAANFTEFGFGQSSFVSGAFSKMWGNTGLGLQLEALERKGLFKVLAEPNLVALSGEQAEFLAGGEFPIPVPQDLGTISIEYKPFGVAVKFTPIVLSENRIRIQVMPEVSEIAAERAIEIEGFTVPSFNTRRASTTVELAPGESFMIAGLIKDSLISNIDQIPGAGDIPILGALMRSNSFERNETELVLAVTPYIVDPLKSSDVKMPTDDFRPASFMEQIFFGALGAQPGIGEEKPSLEGPSGYMTD
jgi:pilus assembly protein CpaC